MYGFSPYGFNPYFPPNFATGEADFEGPFGRTTAMVRGQGTVQSGPAGISTSVPPAPGFDINAGNTVNGLGLASPFAQSSGITRLIAANSFGIGNPYSPLIATPWTVFDPLAYGSFGPIQNSLSPLSFTGIPIGNSII